MNNRVEIESYQLPDNIKDPVSAIKEIKVRLGIIEGSINETPESLQLKSMYGELVEPHLSNIQVIHEVFLGLNAINAVIKQKTPYKIVTFEPYLQDRDKQREFIALADSSRDEVLSVLLAICNRDRFEGYLNSDFINLSLDKIFLKRLQLLVDIDLAKQFLLPYAPYDTIEKKATFLCQLYKRVKDPHTKSLLTFDLMRCLTQEQNIAVILEVILTLYNDIRRNVDFRTQQEIINLCIKETFIKHAFNSFPYILAKCEDASEAQIDLIFSFIPEDLKFRYAFYLQTALNALEHSPILNSDVIFKIMSYLTLSDKLALLFMNGKLLQEEAKTERRSEGTVLLYQKVLSRSEKVTAYTNHFWQPPRVKVKMKDKMIDVNVLKPEKMIHEAQSGEKSFTEVKRQLFANKKS